MTSNHCHYCMESLLDRRYMLREENSYCVTCYDSLFANTCEECKQHIECDAKDLAYKGRHWHEACFKCAKCNHSLVEKPFAAKDELLLCTQCYSNEYSSKCFHCQKTIMPDIYIDRIASAHKMFQIRMPWTFDIRYEVEIIISNLGENEQQHLGYVYTCSSSRKMEFKGSCWHETCFVCQYCQQPLGTKPLVTKDNENYCMPCFEKQFAHHCYSCKKMITTGGVTYHDQPWHKECFLCAGCKQQLSGQRFISKDDHPYCLDCFSSLYAKKCTACNKPITALGGAKFISFEERQWHSDCFNCVKCSISLVGQGFLTHRDDILCRECGSTV